MSGKKQGINYTKVESNDKGVSDLYMSPGQQSYDGTQIRNEYYEPIDYSKLQNDFNKRIKSKNSRAYTINTGVGTIVTYDRDAVTSARNNINQASQMPDIGRTLTFDKVSQIGSVQEGFDKNAKEYMENLVNQTYDIKNGMQLMPWQEGYINATEGSRAIAKINKLFDDYVNNIGQAYAYAGDLGDAYKIKEGEVGAVSLTNFDRTNEAMLLSQWKAGDPNVYLIDNDGETALYRPSLNGKPEAILNLSKFGSAMEQEGDYISRIFDYKTKLDGVGEQYVGSISEDGKTGYITSVVDYDMETTKDGQQVIKASTVKFKPGMYEKAVEAAAKGDPVIQRILDNPEHARQMWLDVFRAPVPYDPKRDQETLRNLIARKAINDKGMANAMGRVEGSYVIDDNGQVVSYETFVDAAAARGTKVEKIQSNPNNNSSTPTKTYNTQFDELIKAAYEIKTTENTQGEGEAPSKVMKTVDLLQAMRSDLPGMEDATFTAAQKGEGGPYAVYINIPANQKNAARKIKIFGAKELETLSPYDISYRINTKIKSIPQTSIDTYFPNYDVRFKELYPDYKSSKGTYMEGKTKSKSKTEEVSPDSKLNENNIPLRLRDRNQPPPTT